MSTNAENLVKIGQVCSEIISQICQFLFFKWNKNEQTEFELLDQTSPYFYMV